MINLIDYTLPKGHKSWNSIFDTAVAFIEQEGAQAEVDGSWTIALGDLTNMDLSKAYEINQIKHKIEYSIRFDTLTMLALLEARSLCPTKQEAQIAFQQLNHLHNKIMSEMEPEYLETYSNLKDKLLKIIKIQTQ